jgi:hypothetical protein
MPAGGRGVTIRRHEDPIRWRDLPTSGAQNRIDVAEEVAGELGEAARLLEKSLPADDLRLAQIRHRVALRLSQGRAEAPLLLRRPFRIAILLIASVGLGGVATAVTGRFLGWRRAIGTMLTHGAVTSSTPTRGRETHRWRVAVDAPAELDLIVGPEGTELAVVEGRVHIAPADGADGASVTVGPGSTWHGVVEGVVPGVVQDSGPSQGPTLALAQSPSPKTLSLGQRPHREIGRTVARAAPPDAEGPRDPEPLVALPVTGGDGSPVTPPRFEPRVASTDQASAREALASAPRAGSTSSVSAPSSLRPGPASSPPPSAPESSSEAAMLMTAFRRLRTGHDPIGALALIDAYDHLFERRGLAREATLARAEALLALGRKNAALTVLDGLNLSGSSIDRRAALARAELRAAERRRAADAIRDFDLVLESGVDDELSARALYGRAVLREAAGDVAGARADLREHLKRFGGDARRGDVMAMLDRLGG